MAASTMQQQQQQLPQQQLPPFNPLNTGATLSQVAKLSSSATASQPTVKPKGAIVTLPCGHQFVESDFKERVRWNYTFDQCKVKCPKAECAMEVPNEFIKAHNLDSECANADRWDDDEKEAERNSVPLGDSDTETDEQTQDSDTASRTASDDDGSSYSEDDSDGTYSDDTDGDVHTEKNDSETEESDLSGTDTTGSDMTEDMSDTETSDYSTTDSDSDDY